MPDTSTSGQIGKEIGREIGPGISPQIGPARAEDAPALAALSIEVWLGTYIREGVAPVFADYALRHFTAEAVAGWIAAPEGVFLVARDAAGPVGYLRLEEARPAPVAAPGVSPAEIVTLYVRPRFHGVGLGRALLAAGLEAAQARGLPRPWLAVNSENTGALAFYAACGFVSIGQTVFRIGDGAYPNELLAAP